MAYEQLVLPKLRRHAAMGGIVASIAIGVGSGCSNGEGKSSGSETAALYESYLEKGHIKDSKFGIDAFNVSIWRHPELNIESSDFNPNLIRSSVKRIINFANSIPNFASTLGFDVSLTEIPDHDFIIGRNLSDINKSIKQLSDHPPTEAPAATLIYPDRRISLISPVGAEYPNKYNPAIDLNFLGVQVEVCNNFLEIDLSQATKDMMSRDGITLTDEQMNDLTRISFETLCNSYGIVSASKHAGLDYKTYESIVKSIAIPKAVTGGSEIPYILFEEPTYQQL